MSTWREDVKNIQEIAITEWLLEGRPRQDTKNHWVKLEGLTFFAGSSKNHHGMSLCMKAIVNFLYALKRTFAIWRGCVARLDNVALAIYNRYCDSLNYHPSNDMVIITQVDWETFAVCIFFSHTFILQISNTNTKRQLARWFDKRSSR